jgi:hypothetical protein
MLFLARAINQEIYTAPYQGRDGTGKPTYGTPILVLAREDTVSQGVARNGAQGTSNTVQGQLFTFVQLGPQDRVWISGAAVAAVQAWLAALGNPTLAASAAAAAQVVGPAGSVPQRNLNGAVEYYLADLV